MKDFKKLPKMACGGKVKKMAEGGSSSYSPYDPSKETEIGGNIGTRTFVEEAKKGWATKPMQQRLDEAYQKSTEARDEAKREASRGIKPENRKKGGRITKKVGTVKKNK
jgi:hypothetical protein